MLSILGLGFLVGLQHAFEADHLAAVASIATRAQRLSDSARHGAIWGLGHTLTLFFFGGAVLMVDSVIPERVASGLELAVGVMLVLLGADVLRRVIRERVHFHFHQHGEQVHFHAHAHEAGEDHARDPHDHEHPKRLPLRSLFVGMMHGMAGSAALIVLALGAVTDPLEGLAFIAIFGVGSIVGMALVGLAIGVPIRYSPKSLGWLHNGTKVAVGVATIALGAWVTLDRATHLLT